MCRVSTPCVTFVLPAGGKSVNDDAERLMIAKLKSECGFAFTSKLVRR
jgi:hypothetical protein